MKPDEGIHRYKSCVGKGDGERRRHDGHLDRIVCLKVEWRLWFGQEQESAGNSLLENRCLYSWWWSH